MLLSGKERMYVMYVFYPEFAGHNVCTPVPLYGRGRGRSHTVHLPFTHRMYVFLYVRFTLVRHPDQVS
jgi:hypothetical protein